MARLLFIGLWTECDDQGAFEWKPVSLKMRLLPADNVDVGALLEELAALNMIMAYQHEGRQLGLVRNFCRFQRPKKPNSVHFIPAQFRTYVASGVPSSEPHGRTRASGSEPETRKGGRSSELEARKRAAVPQKSEIAPQMEDGGGRREDVGKEDNPPRRVQPLRASPEPPPAPAPAAPGPTAPAKPPASAPAEPHGAGRGADADGAGKPDFCDLGERVLEAVGIDPARWQGNFAEAQLWLNRGFDAERDVLPAVRAIAEQKCRTGAKDWPPRSLRFFTGAIERFHDERIGAPAATAPPRPPPDAPAEGTVAWWRWMVGLAVESGEWPTVLGPRLTKARAQPATCPIPDAVLEEFGFPAKEPRAGAGAAA